MHLEVDQNITPVVAPPRRVPASFKGQLKQELDRLQEIGVITPVDEPTQWVNGLAVAVKKTGALRICLDPRPLNTALRRERYQLPVLEDILPELSEARIFSTVDLKSGYWHCVVNQVPLQHSPLPMADTVGVVYLLAYPHCQRYSRNIYTMP